MPISRIDPRNCRRLLQAFDDEPDVDIVYTTFEMDDGGRSRLTSRLFHAVFARLTDVDIPQNLGTYRVFGAAVRRALLDYPERSAVYGPLMAQMGFTNRYVHVTRAHAVGRESSYTFRRRLALGMSSIISYGSFLHRFVMWIGLSLTILSAGYLIVLTVQYVGGYRDLVNGQLLLLGITVLMSGVLLMTVGVLTAYTFRIFQEVLARPRYHVARRVRPRTAACPMRLAVLQSNYIPWKGYFDLMAMADLFIVYDSVQYTKNDWRNRNILPTPSGPDLADDSRCDCGPLGSTHP